LAAEKIISVTEYKYSVRSIATVERTMERVGFHAFSNLEGSSGKDIEDV